MNIQTLFSGIVTWIEMLPVWAAVIFKATLLLAICWAVYFSMKRVNPRWRVMLWRGLALSLVLLPLLIINLPAVQFDIAVAPVTTSTNTSPVIDGVEPLIENSIAPSLLEFEPIQQSNSFPWQKILLAAWIAGAIILSVRFVIGFKRIKRLINDSTPVSQNIVNRCRTIAEELGCKRDPDVRMLKDLTVPLLTGLGRPVLLLPDRMCRPDYSGDLDGIIAHELSHQASNDLLWGHIFHCITIAIWFHPLVWRIRAAHSSACEEVSDAVSANFVGDTGMYSRTLARVAVEMSSRPPALCSVPMARMSQLGQRLERLKKKVFSAPLRRRGIVSFTLIGVSFLLLMSCVNIGCKSEPEETEETKTITEDNTAKEKQAVEAATAWLKLIDEEKYSEGWDNAATYFKSFITSEEWQKAVGAARRPLGKLISRKVISTKYTTSAPGAPDGEYVVILYETTFENKAEAVETVTPMKEKDGQWRISGYFIK